MLTEADELVTAETIRNKFMGKTEKLRSLIGIFKQHNKKVEALLGKEFTKGTLVPLSNLFKTYTRLFKMEV